VQTALFVVCLVDGVWGNWTLWSSCSATCGGGTMVRTRTCEGPFHGGLPCNGAAREQSFCNDDPCPGTTSLLPHCISADHHRQGLT